MVISTLYLPGTAADTQHQYAPTRAAALPARPTATPTRRRDGSTPFFYRFNRPDEVPGSDVVGDVTTLAPSSSIYSFIAMIDDVEAVTILFYARNFSAALEESRHFQ
jgi:hypothetical protein